MYNIIINRAMTYEAREMQFIVNKQLSIIVSTRVLN